MRITKILFPVFIGLVIWGCSNTNFASVGAEKLNEYLKSHPNTNASYMFVQGDKVVLKGAQGFFDRENKVALNEDQAMPIASGTKQMSAAMILRLQERGVLTITDTVAKLIPADSGWWLDNKLPEWAEHINLHHLLTHTSGIAEYIPALPIDVTATHDKIKHDITNFIATTAVVHKPGEQYSYSNSNYFLIGIIIERLTGKNLADLFKEEFFIPLGMNNTHMASLEEAVKFQNGELINYPSRYFGVPTGTEPHYMPAKVSFYVVPFADGGVVSTVEDLVKWNQAFHNGKVVSSSSYKLMTTPYIDAPHFPAKDLKIGYGVYIQKLPDGEAAFYHAGRAVGIRCEHGYIPASKIYFAILSNVMGYETPEMAGKTDYTLAANQFDIVFFREALFNIVAHNK